MSESKYNSRIEKPVVHTTSKGGRYVRPFDILRSETGRAVIKSHAASAAAAKARVAESSVKDGDCEPNTK